MLAVVSDLPAVSDADDRLIQLAAAGDAGAFDRLVGPHVDTGFRMAVSMLADREEAEDAVQEATLKAWRAIGRLRPGSNLRAWFLTIVANHCRSQMRRRWWSVVRLPDTERQAADPAGQAESRVDVARALRALGREDRLAVFLRYYEDMTLEEVAAVTGVSVSAARSRVYRALRKMRVDLDEGEVSA